MADIKAQDTPPPEALMREQRAEEGKPAATDLSGSEIVKIALMEFKEQSALRGPIQPEEWPGVAIYYRRLNAPEQKRIGDLFEAQGTWGTILVERALNSKGEKIFHPSQHEDFEQGATFEVVKRICTEMANGSRTQLTDAELGKS